MKRLSEVIRKYADVEPVPAGGERRRKLSDEERQLLRIDLTAIQRVNGRLIWVATGLLVVLFMAWIAIVFIAIRNPAVVQSASAGMGLSAAGSIVWLLRIWREKTNTEMLIRLAVAMEGEALKTIINILATRKII